ncbi:GH116 family glycosyl hydrolase [Poseidonocella sp. HB161398]|uniref:GH116 family glycosyl hydrolase n=1 Tax=Poseidonocella sp. HB161398 TaxID=2320855 RepID=UPI001982153C|nr:GH116 family glycosyl hydrolase [Poseidonocella sp. HB161398]
MTEFDTLPLRPEADGRLTAPQPVMLPFMAPRLQGDLHPNGRLTLSVWGCGHIATLSLKLPEGPFAYSPNCAEWTGGGLFVAQSRPVLLLRGARLTRAAAARRGAWWAREETPGKVEHRGARRVIRTAWGIVLLLQAGGDLIVAAGESEAEAEAALALPPEEIRAEAAAHVARCDQAPGAAPLMRTMVSQSTHAGLSAIRRDAAGGFAGLAAGQAYSAPARTYYRDGYWTLQILLRLAPEAVAGQIEILARGIQPDGETPSGVILTGPRQSERWEEVRRSHPKIVIEHLRPGDWWSDHFDSPLFFVLTVADYVRATGDRAVLERHWPVIAAIYRRYRGFERNGVPLPYKPRNDRDWADNVYRHGYVAYDLGLWIGALDAMAELGGPLDANLAAEAAETAAAARAAIEPELLTEGGWLADYGDRRDFREDHLTLDSLTLLRFGAVSEARAKTVLARAREMLESRGNAEQPYGDWGVMCAYPPFARRGDTREKTVFAFRYHNGSDWPYLSGLYAEVLADHGMDPVYPMTRWWRTCLENGWAGAVEYFAPPWGRGSLLQGWSAMPAHVWLSREGAWKAAAAAELEGA